MEHREHPRCLFCCEMMGWALPDSSDNCLKLIKAVDRRALAVHLDPCNVINSAEKFYRNTDLLNECLDKLGRWIASCHGNDLAWDVGMNVHFREVCPGNGAPDFSACLRRLAQWRQDAPLMLEHLSPAEDSSAAREHVIETGREAGLSFG